MIDYNKLKIAHELAEKYYNDTSICNSIRIEYYFDDEPYISYQWHNTREDKIDLYKHIDELIIKLKELTQPDPKYKEGQKIYALYAREITQLEVLCNEWDAEKGAYRCEIVNPRLWWYEHEIYPTKSALIEAQIEYWQSLRDQLEDVRDMVPAFEGEVMGFKCQHESDELVYCSYPLRYKCIKCGEFYQ